MDKLLINKITRKNGINYVWLSDGSKFSLPHSMFKSFPWKTGGIIESLDELEAWKSKCDYKYAKNFALYMLSIRARSRAELESALLTRGYSETTALEIVSDFMKSGYIEDTQYASNFVRSSVEKGQGKYRIKAALRRKGLSNDDIENALNEQSDEQFVHSALILVRRLARGKDILQYKNQQMIKSSLIRKGFSLDEAQRALQEYIADQTTK